VTTHVAGAVLPRLHALHTRFGVWRTNYDRFEHHTGAWHRVSTLLRRERIGDGTVAGADDAVDVETDISGPARVDPVVVARAAARSARSILSRRPGAVPMLYVFDEPKPSENGRIRWLGAALRAHAPGVRQLVTSPPIPSLMSSVGVWAMHVGALTPSTVAAVHRAGAEAWSYTSCCEDHGAPTLLIDDTAVRNAAVPVAAWLHGADGLLYWSVFAAQSAPYPTARTPAEVRTPALGDGQVIYPGSLFGRAAPLPSFRLELVREALQITDEAQLLVRRGDGALARSILSRLVGTGGSVSGDPRVWADAELRLARALD